MFNLNRFLKAQEGVYEQALSEIRNGHKEGHWMWFTFPQLKGLGRSPQSGHFGILNLDEAIAYVSDEVLGCRLREICSALRDSPCENAIEIFGGTDAQKLRSSMTLFAKTPTAAASDNAEQSIFDDILHKFFGGQTCAYTLQHLAQVNTVMIAKALSGMLEPFPETDIYFLNPATGGLTAKCEDSDYTGFHRNIRLPYHESRSLNTAGIIKLIRDWCAQNQIMIVN